MIIVSESAASLKVFLGNTGLNELARMMLLRVVLAFIMHRGRMSCSAAAGSIASESIHRGELTRFMARPRWQKHDFNAPLRQLQTQGLIELAKADHDARVREIRLTADGAALEAKLTGEQEKLFADAFARSGEKAHEGWRAVMLELARHAGMK